MALRINLCFPPPILLPNHSKSQHYLLTTAVKANKFKTQLSVRCNSTTNGDLSNTELGFEFAAEVEKLKSQKDAMKRSKELLFVEVCKYLAMEKESEAVKRKWKKMDEDEKLGFVKRFVEDWGVGFHPLSTRAAKEMIDEYVLEMDEDDGEIVGEDSLLLKLKNFMGF